MSPPQVFDRFPAWLSAALSSARPFLNGSSVVKPALVKPAFKPSLLAREKISPAGNQPYRSRSICARFHHKAPAHRMGQCCGRDSPGGTPGYNVQKCAPEYHGHLARRGRSAHRHKRVCIPPPGAAESRPCAARQCRQRRMRASRHAPNPADKHETAAFYADCPTAPEKKRRGGL